MDGDVTFFGIVAAVGVAAATDATTAAFGLVPFLIAGFVFVIERPKLKQPTMSQYQ